MIKYINEHPVLYYFLSFTWGGIMSLIGTIVILALIMVGKKPHKCGNSIYVEVGEYWGGLELGCFFICCKNPGDHILLHESGHGFQNIMFGPLMPFIVSIPSAIRYWYRRLSQNNKTEYDAIWFEGQASALGYEYNKEKLNEKCNK